jgi:N-methylhydantoinase A
MEVQSVSWSVTVTTKPDAPEKAADGVPNTSAIPLNHRKVYDSFSGEQVECPVYWRFDLNPGTRFSGPAVIAEEETTTIVPGHFSASINSLGHIVMETLPLEHENG